MRRRFTRYLGLLSVLVLVFASPVATRGEGPVAQYPELTGDDVITFDVTRDQELSPIINGKRLIIQGERHTDGTCRFAYRTPGFRRGDPIPASRVLAYDRATCRELIEEGEYGGPPIPSSELPAPIPATLLQSAATPAAAEPM